MKFTLVGAHNGKPVIHWPGVLTATAVMTLAVTVGALLGCFLLGRSFFLLPWALVMNLPMLMVIGIQVRRGLKTPPAQLPPV